MQQNKKVIDFLKSEPISVKTPCRSFHGIKKTKKQKQNQMRLWCQIKPRQPRYLPMKTVSLFHFLVVQTGIFDRGTHIFKVKLCNRFYTTIGRFTTAMKVTYIT